MKKKILLAVLAAALCAVTAGCGSGSGTTSETSETKTEENAAFTPKLDTEEEVTLNIIGALENFESLEAVISDFSEIYPNCEVLYSYLEDYKNMLGTRLASDDSVGIFMINSAYYAGNVPDKCVDLSQEDIDTSVIQSGALSAYTADNGKLYGIPLAQNTSGLIVNKTLLENEGLSVPQNYEEFLSVCESLKQKGYTPIQGCQADASVNLMRNMAYVLLNQTYNTEEKVKTLTSGAEGCVDFLLPAYEILSELYEKGYIDETVNATYEDNYNDAILKFFEGDVPFLSVTTETFSGTKKRETKSEHFAAESFEYEFICAPLADDGAYSYIENWQGFAVNNDCEDKEWALEFMRFLSTEEELNQLANIKGLPSVTNDSDDDRFAMIHQDNEELEYTADVFFPAEVSDYYYWTVEDFVDGKVDAAGAVEELEGYLSGKITHDSEE